MFGKKFRLNLALKFMLTLSGLALIVIPVTSYLFISQSLKVLRAEADEKAQILKDNLKGKGLSMSRNIALNIASAVAGSDFSFLQDVISSSVASDKEIRYGIIVNREGRALVHSDSLQVFQVLDAEQDVKSRSIDELTVFEYELEKEDILEVAIPIKLGQERWGTLRMGYTLQYLEAELARSLERQRNQREALIRTAVLISAASIFAGSILATLYSRQIVGAVRTILRATQTVSKGDFSPRVSIKTGDELETLGNAVNVMTQNLETLSLERMQKARMETELLTAELVQKKILPKKDPKLPEIEFSSYFRSASETGGDWFTYWHDPESGQVDVMIGDVTGHGLPAALLTEAAHSCFHTAKALTPGLKPRETLKILNRVLIPQMDRQYGMTAFLSKIDLANRSMIYANAGHNMPIVFAPNGGGKRKPGVLLSYGPRLGDAATDEFDERSMTFSPGTLIFWYTDGLLDCVNEKQDVFGKKRVLEILSEHAEQQPATIRDSLVDEIMRFTEGRRPPDDITFIVGKVT